MIRPVPAASASKVFLRTGYHILYLMSGFRWLFKPLLVSASGRLATARSVSGPYIVLCPDVQVATQSSLYGSGVHCCRDAGHVTR
jgi:hypothetical protein